MQQIAINNYIIQGVPEGANTPLIFNDDKPYLSCFVGTSTLRFYLPSGTYQLIGRCSETGEDTWGKVVEPVLDYEHMENSREEHEHPLLGYKDYLATGQMSYLHFKETATESGLSLLSHHSLTPQSAFLLKKI